MLERARRIRKDRDYTNLLERAVSSVSRDIERAALSAPLARDLAFVYSKREIDARMASERTLEDVLDTTGTYYEPRGAYRGYGPYRSLRALQHRGEITDLARAVRRHDPETVMEIGSANGGTLYVWARALDGVRTMLSTDLDYRGRRDFLEYVAGRSGVSLRCIEGDSQSETTRRAVREALSGDAIDFLYIDGDHSYEGVRADFEAYEPLVADDGLIGLHDVETGGTGVPRLWDELTETRECRTFAAEDRYGPSASGLVYKGGRA